MDFNFKDLVHQAERNAKRQERKVLEAEREMKARQQQHMERLAYEKAREKLALKRRAPPPVPQRQQSPPPALPLPPLAASTSGATAAKRDRTPRHDTVAGGNKGPPQLPRKPVDGGEPTFVIPKKRRSTEAGGVQRADEASQQRRSKSTPNKAPEADVGVSAGRELTYAAAQAVVEKKKRLSATGYRILAPEDSEPKLASSKSMPPPPAQQQQQQKMTRTVPANGQTLATPKVAKIVERDKPSKTQQGNGQQMSRQTNGTSALSHSTPKQQKGNGQQMSRQTNGTSALSHSTPKQQKVPNIATTGSGKSVNNKMVTTNANKKATPNVQQQQQVQAQQQQSQPQPAQQQQPQQPQKRYLPGDVRYQGTPSAAKAQQPAVKKAVVPTNVGGGPPPQVDNKRKANTGAESSLTTAAKSAGVAPKQRKMETTAKGAELGKFRSREMELEAALKREREKVARMMAMAKEVQNRKPKPQQHQQAMITENTGSLARIKREAQLRREMALAHQRDRQPSSSSRKFANYSETDDDDENDDYRGRREDEEDDEYDSDMADFIDDSMVDDMQREDFEETLKIINPRYNKEQWLLRERMIDERRMDARFRDVEAEERHSSRLGLVEDLREAKRGSKALG
uniref:Protein SPT2 homolog n=1 Tax=Globodera pallida TaxID=36090 RepID=A0A183BUJ5_GLOPA